MLLCHLKFSFKKDKLNFRFIGTLKHELGAKIEVEFLLLDRKKQ